MGVVRFRECAGRVLAWSVVVVGCAVPLIVGWGIAAWPFGGWGLPLLSVVFLFAAVWSRTVGAPGRFAWVFMLAILSAGFAWFPVSLWVAPVWVAPGLWVLFACGWLALVWWSFRGRTATKERGKLTATAEDFAAALPAGYGKAVAEGVAERVRHKRTSAGRRYTVQLPRGVTADQFKPVAFAGAHDVPDERVRRVKGASPRMLVVDVLDVDPASLPTPAFPLLGRDRVDFGRPVPVGVTTIGDPVAAEFKAHRALYGGQSGSGKTWAMRLPVLAAALDPATELYIIDMKGETDWLPFARVATRVVNSGSTDDAMRVVDEVVQERRARSKAKREHGTVPGPLLLVIDECQNMPDWDGAKELMKEGRSAGISIVMGTQAPKGNAIPTDVSAQFDTRWCGKMHADWQWRLVLGDAMGRPEIDVTQVRGKGVGWLIDSDDNASLVRGYAVTDDEIVAALAGVPGRGGRAVEAGESVESVVDTEVLAVVEVPREDVPLLERVVAVWPDNKRTGGKRKGLHVEDLAALLGMPQTTLVKELREVEAPLRYVGTSPLAGGRSTSKLGLYWDELADSGAGKSSHIPSHIA